MSDKSLQSDALDGLRGVAAFVVFLSHASLFGIHLIPGLNLAGIGKSGLYLFFLLSAFLLSIPFIRYEWGKLTPAFFANYALRRFFRIYPLYMVYIGLSALTTFLIVNQVATSPSFPLALSLSEAFEHLTLQAGKGVTWSIAVEFKYYAFLPIVALCFRMVREFRIYAGTTLLLLLVAACWYLWPPNASQTNDLRVGPYLSIFLTGSFLALLHVKWQANPISKQSRVTLEIIAWITIGLQILMIPMVINLIIDNDLPRNYTHKYFFAYALLWSPVLLAAAHSKSLLNGLLTSRVCRFFGFISFSFYLWHMPIHEIWRGFGIDSTLAGWGSLMTSFVLSTTTWYLIEKPFSRIVFSRDS